MTTPSAPRISEDELARLEELAEKATPGPWRAMSVSDQNNRWTVGPFGASSSLFVGSRVRAEDDAFFIAAANPDTIRRLIVAVRLAARSAPAAGLDVERLARAFHAENERTAAAFDGVLSCDHDDDRPECVGEAEAIAREYAALAAALREPKP